MRIITDLNEWGMSCFDCVYRKTFNLILLYKGRDLGWQVGGLGMESWAHNFVHGPVLHSCNSQLFSNTVLERTSLKLEYRQRRFPPF